MEFCIISPIAGLERYSTLSKTHLLLPQIQDQRYWDFYLKRRAAGDTIILDNGAYEGELNNKRLLECIGLIQPNVIALPDHLGADWKASHHLSMNFLESYHYTYEGGKWMYIPQAEPGDIIGFVESLFRALDDERIGVIGLPRVLSYSITNDLSMRVRMAEQIRKRNSRVKIHALGMVKGSVEECRLLRESGCVNSIDSNAPVWRGWNGWALSEIRYTHGQPPQYWPEIPVDYNAVIPISCTDRGQEEGVNGAHQLILRNLEACGVNTNIHSRTGSSTQG